MAHWSIALADCPVGVRAEVIRRLDGDQNMVYQTRTLIVSGEGRSAEQERQWPLFFLIFPGGVADVRYCVRVLREIRATCYYVQPPAGWVTGVYGPNSEE